MGFQRKLLRRAISQNLKYPLNLKLWNLLGEPPITVTFTGGLGAQVISTAIYEMLKTAGLPVCADFSYFQRPTRINKGIPSEGISNFPWQLSELGIQQDTFAHVSKKCNPWVSIEDGPVKLALFLEAVKDPAIRQKLSRSRDVTLLNSLMPTELRGKRYGCVHIRRGDYLSVASHVVSDSELADASALWEGNADLIVALSDSPISSETRNLYRERSRKPYLFADDVSPISCFAIMQNAQYLICSNSQFSLSAGMCAGLPMLIPSRWYTYPDVRPSKHNQSGQLAHLEELLVKKSSFMLVNPPAYKQKDPSITDRSSFFRFIATC
mgnify:CR=1 FL=1